MITDPKLNKARRSAVDGFFGSDIHGLLDLGDGEEEKHRFPKAFFDLKGAWGEGFGVAHILLATTGLRKSLRDGDRVLQLIQGM